jgi:outer membrane protein TolC
MWSSCFVVLAGGAVACLASCASYHPEPLSATNNAQAIEVRSLEDPRLQTFIASAQARPSAERPEAITATRPVWNLSTLTLAALYYHPDLDIARTRLALARAGVITARQIPNPSLSFEDLSFAPGTHGPAAWTLTPLINFLIETAGKRTARTRKAREQVAAARSDLAMASWKVRGGVREALLALWVGERRLALLREQLALQDQLATLLEHRLAVGEASALDVARERTARNQVSLAVDDAVRESEAARAQLAAAIGIALPALAKIDLSFEAFDRPEEPVPAPDSGQLMRQALTSRSDVQSLLAQYAAAEAALALEVANQYPNLTLSPGYSFDSVQDRYLLLPALDLPIFNHNQGPIAQRRAEREQAAARFTALQTQIVDAVEGAAAAYQASAHSVAMANALLTGEQERERRTLRSLRDGAIDRPTLLTVQLERVAAEQSRLGALAQQRQSLGTLEDALQHPFFGPALPESPETNPRLAATSPAR